MTDKVITLTLEFVVPTALAIVLGISLSICAVYLTDCYVGSIEQARTSSRAATDCWKSHLSGALSRSSLAVGLRSGLDGLALGDGQLRILAIMALALTLVGCTGDRVKQGMNSPGSVVTRVSQSAAWSSWSWGRTGNERVVPD
jgi:hypothetical protein